MKKLPVYLPFLAENLDIFFPHSIFSGQLIPVHTSGGDTCSSSDFMVPSISSLSYGDDGVFSGIDICNTSGNSSSALATMISGGSAVHRVFNRCLRELEEVLLGYVLPEPFFSEWLKPKLDELFQCLRDPNLPLLELEVSRRDRIMFSRICSDSDNCC